MDITKSRRMSSSNHPITSGLEGETEYARAYKKHFAQRPTAFALSERSPTPSSSFAPPVERGGVDSETHNQLANLGWKIRSRVNHGYSRTTTSLDPFGEKATAGFVSERDVLANVTNSRRKWGRVRTAPTLGTGAMGTFDEMRAAQHAVDTNTLLRPAAGKVAKRRRTDDESSDEEDGMEQTREERAPPLPNLSSSSSTSTASVFSDPPNPSASVADDSEMQLDPLDLHPFRKLHDEQVQYDFSSHFNRTDF